jgi:hypothetical protein
MRQNADQGITMLNMHLAYADGVVKISNDTLKVSNYTHH